MGGPYGPYGLNMPLPLDQNLFSNMHFPFLAPLQLLDLSRLTNDPIHHNLAWTNDPLNILKHIPKFDDKIQEDMKNHIMTYHLWFVSNSLLDDSIYLRLFPCTVTSNTSKWFIELLTASFNNFNAL